MLLYSCFKMSGRTSLLAVAALGAALSAQTAPPPPAAAAQSYSEFAMGKWAELQAVAHANTPASGAYVQQALQHYGAAMAADPHSAYIAAQMADFLSRLGRTADATTLAQTVVKEHPDSVAGHQTLGRIYLRELSRMRQPISGAAADGAVAEYQALVRLEPAEASPVIVLGKLYGAEGKAPEAEAQFRAALAIAPTNVDALASLVQSLASQDRLDEAQKQIAALPAVARSGQVYAALGDAFMGRQRYPEAAAAYREAVDAQPDEPAFVGALAKALMQGGDFSQALAEYSQLQTQTPDDGDVPLRIGQLQMQMGNFAAAEGSLKSAASLLGPDNLEVGYAQALLQESQGKNPQALAGLRSLAERKTSPATQSIFLAQLAQLQLRTGDAAAADATLQQLGALGPSYHARAQSLAIEMYSGARDFPRALAAAKSALAEQPDSRPLHITYANLLAASGQLEAAKAALQPLLKGTASDGEVYLAQSEIESGAQQWPAALADARRADQIAATPLAHARAAAQRGAIEAKQAQYPQAEQSYQQALELAPDDAHILNSFGYLLAEQGTRLPDALQFVQKALARDPGNGAFLDSLGWVYFKMNRLPEAVGNLERAARIANHDPAVLDHLAQAYEGDGKLQQAERSWQQALADSKLSPGDALQSSAIQKRLDAVKVRIAQQQRN